MFDLWLFIFLVGLVLTILVYYHEKSSNRKSVNGPLQLTVGHLSRRVKNLEEKVDKTLNVLESFFSEMEKLKETEERQKNIIQQLTDGLKETFKAQIHLAKTLTTLNEKISNLNKRYKEDRLRTLSSEKMQTFSKPRWGFFPEEKKIREVEVARLTPTEMKVLRVLATSGPKSASEIKEVIGKTREHSARLMKKLFLEGYVERDTTTIPYTYRLSKKIRESFEFSTGNTEE